MMRMEPHEWRVPCKGMKRPKLTPWESWLGLQTQCGAGVGGGGAKFGPSVRELRSCHAVKTKTNKKRERKTEAFPLPCEWPWGEGGQPQKKEGMLNQLRESSIRVPTILEADAVLGRRTEGQANYVI